MNMLNPNFARTDRDHRTMLHRDEDHVPMNRRAYLGAWRDASLSLSLATDADRETVLLSLIRQAIDDETQIEPDVNLAILDACASAVGCDTEPDGGYRYLESLAY